MIGLVDGDAAAIKLLTVHALDGVTHGLVVVEVDETEPTGPVHLLVVDDLSEIIEQSNGLARCSANSASQYTICAKGAQRLQDDESQHKTKK